MSNLVSVPFRHCKDMEVLPDDKAKKCALYEMPSFVYELKKLCARRLFLMPLGLWIGDGDFASDIGVQLLEYLCLGKVLSQKIHEFGDGALEGAIITIDNTSLKQLQACGISAHLDRTL